MSNYLTGLETRRVIGVTRRVISKAPYHGNVLDASQQCGVPQPTLSRFYNDPPDRIKWKTFRGLWKLDPSLDWEGLVLSKKARRNLDLWDQWVEGQARLRAGVQGFLANVSEPRWKKVDEFRNWARKKRHTERRINLSLNRALGSLFPTALTGGLERSYSDLIQLAAVPKRKLAATRTRSKEQVERDEQVERVRKTYKEVIRFVEAALTCERILLSHPPADLRAREIYPTDPVGRTQEAATRFKMRKGKRVNEKGEEVEEVEEVKGQMYFQPAKLPRKRARKSKAKRRPRN